MTNFDNGFNPNKHLNGAQFNTRKHGSNPAADQNASSGEKPGADPYAAQRLTPDEVFKLMSAQSQFNKAAGVDNRSILESVKAFESDMSPEAYDELSGKVADVYEEEFGVRPGDEMLEEIVSNLLTGQPVIQA